MVGEHGLFVAWGHLAHCSANGREGRHSYFLLMLERKHS